jgi:hypothetical protein
MSWILLKNYVGILLLVDGERHEKSQSVQSVPNNIKDVYFSWKLN